MKSLQPRHVGTRIQIARHSGRALPILRVSRLPGERHKAKIIVGSTVSPCVLGPAGITHRKREGDGGTPAGSFRLRQILFRADREPRPASGLPPRSTHPRDAWCDDARRACYNRPVPLPFNGSHERLWRDDRLYDLLVVLDYNMAPARKGRGSAIFMHVRSADGRPTAGCVAVDPPVLRRLLGRVSRATRVLIR